MEISVSGESVIVRGLSGKKAVAFPFLRPKDLYELQRKVPVPKEHEYVMPSHMVSWVSTFEGSDTVLMLSLRNTKEHEECDVETVWKLGTPGGRLKVARRIFDESIWFGQTDTGVGEDESGQKKSGKSQETG